MTKYQMQYSMQPSSMGDTNRKIFSKSVDVYILYETISLDNLLELTNTKEKVKKKQHKNKPKWKCWTTNKCNHDCSYTIQNNICYKNIILKTFSISHYFTSTYLKWHLGSWTNSRISVKFWTRRELGRITYRVCQ